MKSDKQRKAMYAAAQGKSNIGIPKKVAKQYIKDSSSRGVSNQVNRSLPQGQAPDTQQQKAQLQMAMMEAMSRRK